MAAFPMEMITMGVGTAVGAVLKLSANEREGRRQEFRQMMEASLAQNNIYKDAREFRGDWGFSWTRRVIALLAVFAIIVLPKVAVLLWPDLYVAYASEVYQRISGETLRAVSWDYGYRMLMLTPLDTHLMTAIIGLFFGSEITKRK